MATFQTAIREIIESERLAVPVHVALISANGSAFVIRVDEQQPTILCEHGGDDLEWPLHFLFVDGHGKSLSVTVSASGEKTYVH